MITMMKRWKRICAFVALSLIAVTGCTSQTSEQKEADSKKILFEKRDDTLHLTIVESKIWNPLLVTEESVDYALKLVYDGLFSLNEQYNVVNRLADSFSYQNENKDMTVNIRSDAKWHDGTQVTARDIKYTIDFLKSHPESVYYPMINNIASVSVLNNKTVALHLKQSNILQEYSLLFPIIKYSSGSKTPFVWNGTGRYQFDQSEDVRSLLFKEFSDYYGKIGNIKKIKFEMVETEEIRSNLFLSTDSDMINFGRDDISKYDYELFEVTQFPSLQYEMLLFNTKKEPFHTVKNRQALISALNRDMILKNGYRIDNRCNEIFIPQNSLCHLEGIQIPYDIKRMKRDFVSSEKREYELLVDSHRPLRYAAANLIKQEWKKVGVDIKIVGLSSDELKQRLHSGNYDMALIGYWTGFYPDVMKFASTKNLSFYDTSALQQSLNVIQTQQSKILFLQNYHKFQKQFIQQAFYAGFGHLDSCVAVNRRIQGTLRPNKFDIYYGIEDLKIVDKVYAKQEKKTEDESAVSSPEEKVEESSQE